jgi:hypothetical protein
LSVEASKSLKGVNIRNRFFIQNGFVEMVKIENLLLRLTSS